jgi:hypothetical protein
MVIPAGLLLGQLVIVARRQRDNTLPVAMQPQRVDDLLGLFF